MVNDSVAKQPIYINTAGGIPISTTNHCFQYPIANTQYPISKEGHSVGRKEPTNVQHQPSQFLSTARQVERSTSNDERKTLPWAGKSFTLLLNLGLHSRW